MLSIQNVTKYIKDKPVLTDISLQLQSGKIYLLQGHNGSGKTMILRLLCGLIRPTLGKVIVDPNTSFGVVIESPSFIDGETAYENLRFLASIKKTIHRREILDAMQLLNLYQFRSRKVKTFSLGMKQRLGICQAIMENPDVLLLDEPFNALDDKSYEKVLDIIRKFRQDGKLVVIASHNVDNACKSIIDYTISMSDGKILGVSKTN